MKLTNRDRELINGLATYGMLSTKELNILYFAGVDSSTMLRRLRIIETAQLIRRVGKLETNEYLWGVTAKGGELTGHEYFKTHWSKSMLEHDHQLVGMRLHLESLGISHSWIAEHQLRSMIYKKYSLREAKNKLIPDGLMGVSIKNYPETIAIELELNLKNKSRYQKIMYAYQGKENLHAVWYIVNSRSILNCIKDYWTKARSSYSKVKVYFSYIDEIKKLGLEAKMIGLDSTYLLKNYFDQKIILPAQVGAQSVGTQHLNFNQIKDRLSASIHAPILDFKN